MTTNSNTRKTRPGFTIIELMVTTVVMLVVGLALGSVLAHGQIGWNTMHSRIYSDVVTDGYVAKSKFDSVIRNASRSMWLVDSDGASIEFNYYADQYSAEPDRYAKFYTSNGNLIYEYGPLDTKEATDTETVCSNVTGCTFTQVGGAVNMVLTLESGNQTNTVVTSAVAHNQ